MPGIFLHLPTDGWPGSVVITCYYNCGGVCDRVGLNKV